MSGWVWLISDVNGLPHRVPNNPGVVAFYAARGYEVTDIDGELDSDSEEFAAASAQRQSIQLELKGKALDDALDGAGLSKSGSADEKRQRLAEHQAAVSNPPSGDQPEGNEE